MKIQIRLSRKWGKFSAGDEVLFDESKGLEIIAGGIGVEVKRTMKDNSSIKRRKHKMKMKIRLKKAWGNFEVGQEVMFDESKGLEIIAGGFGEEVKAKKDIPKVETTMVEPAVEKAISISKPKAVRKMKSKKKGN